MPESPSVTQSVASRLGGFAESVSPAAPAARVFRKSRLVAAAIIVMVPLCGDLGINLPHCVCGVKKKRHNRPNQPAVFRRGLSAGTNPSMPSVRHLGGMLSSRHAGSLYVSRGSER